RLPAGGAVGRDGHRSDDLHAADRAHHPRANHALHRDHRREGHSAIRRLTRRNIEGGLGGPLRASPYLVAPAKPALEAEQQVRELASPGVCRRYECPSRSAMSDCCSTPSAGFAGAVFWGEVRKWGKAPLRVLIKGAMSRDSDGSLEPGQHSRANHTEDAVEREAGDQDGEEGGKEIRRLEEPGRHDLDEA